MIEAWGITSLIGVALLWVASVIVNVGTDPAVVLVLYGMGGLLIAAVPTLCTAIFVWVAVRVLLWAVNQ